MPFVPSLPLMLPHLQDEGDPVRAAAEAVDPLMRDRLFRAWDGLALSLAKYTPERIIQPDMLERISQELSDGLAPIAQDLLHARALGLRASLRQIDAVRLAKAVTLSFEFDRLATPVQEQAEQHAAALVREIGEDTRTTLADAIRRGVAAGLAPKGTAQLMRDSVGLTTSQAAAVQNYRRLLETGHPDALVRALRDQRFDIDPEKLVELTPDQIDARVDAYRRRYVMYRANTIARYETLAASNGGAAQATQAAIASGRLPPTTRTVWKIARDENTCERCRSIPRLQPDGVAFGQPFVWEEGKHTGEIMLAPLHPNCRCTNAYRAP